MYWNMIVGLMGGLGLFLYGMKLMGDGLERAAGGKMRGLLEILTRNRLLGVLVGAGFTMIIQSSSATTVMVVGFVNAGLMNLMQAVGVIMGANFGTSITAQLAAFDLGTVAPIALLIGVVMMLFIKRSMTQRIGTVVAGFGILFVGLNMMSAAMKPLRTDAAFISMIHAVASNPASALLIGVAVTTVIQSSSASIVLVQVLADQGMLTLDMSLYICLGCAIGTCVTAMLASTGASRNARRAAVIHLLFNIFGAILLVILLQFLPIADWMRAITDEGDVMRQIANGVMLMKLIEVVVFFPIAGWLVRLSQKIIPGEEPKQEETRALYLDDRLFVTPPIAIAQAIKEVERMAQIARENLARAIEAFIQRDKDRIAEVMHTETVVNFLNHEITTYLVGISQEDMNPGDSALVGSMYHVINDLERVGDHAENIAEFAQSCMEQQIVFSDAAMGELEEMRDKVLALLDIAVTLFHTRDRSSLGDVYAREEEIDDLEKRLQQAHIDRLTAGNCTAKAGMLFSDLLSNLERVADHATNVAFSIAGDEPEEKPKERF